MSATLDCTARQDVEEPAGPTRREVAEKVALFHALRSPWASRRRIADRLKVPARTLYHSVRREWMLIRNSPWPQPVAQFLETPEGLDFLHRLFTAAHLVFVQASDCGLRNLGWFLKLSGLDAFLAPTPWRSFGP